MKKICLIFLASLLLFLPSFSFSDVSVDTHFDNAKQIANFMETHYGITVLIGQECNSASYDSFILGNQPEGRTPFLKLMGVKNYESEIQIIDDAFSIYPAGFFEHFIYSECPKGLRILLADQIVYEGQSMAGVTTINDGYCNIFLGIGAFNRLNIHHELWHAIEFRILSDNPHAFDGWNDLNPEGFEYSDDYFALDTWDHAADLDAYFARGYSTIWPDEDRATVIEALFQKDPEWWFSHPGVARKFARMMEASQPVFGNIYESNE